MHESQDELLARLLGQFHERLASGDQPICEDYRQEAGPHFAAFRELVDQERLFDEAMEGTAVERLPRAFGSKREYVLEECLGRGGISIVYKATQRSVSRTVAIKVLQGGWAGDGEMLRRFLDGARQAAEIEDEHVVLIHDANVFEGRPYIVMSYVEGPTLAQIYDRLREAGGPPFGVEHHAVLSEAGVPEIGGADSRALTRRLASLLCGPAQALSRYHEAGIVHRDVKPGNLILDGRGRLVLTDFDLAKRLETRFSKATATKAGTPGYMSPEQFDPFERTVDGRADVYSLGIVLYEGLTQRTPFKNGTGVSDVMRRTLTEAPASPVTACPDLPPEAARVSLKAIQRRREDRYPDMAAMLLDLQALARGDTVTARPIPLVKRVGRRLWRHRVPLAGLVLTAAFLGWWFLRPAVCHVTSLPHGTEVWIDGRMVGRTPLQHHEVAAGKHEVVLRHPAFEERTESLDVGAGESRVIGTTLEIRRGQEHEAAAALSRSVGVPLVLGDPPSDRGVVEDGPPVVPLFPRGDVRRDDLRVLMAEAREAAKGRVFVRAKAGRELYTEPVDLNLRVLKTPVAAVIDRLVVGREYTWGYELSDGRRFEAAFRLVEVSEARLTASIRERVPDSESRLAELFRIAALQNKGLHDPALNDALRLASTWPIDVVYRVAWRSVEALGLEESDYAAAILARYRNLEK